MPTDIELAEDFLEKSEHAPDLVQIKTKKFLDEKLTLPDGMG